mmetsp:Transcript_7328/g.33037  ORF Transcript_7328/g.33037 Transcript_7328/m.33037 type:complete len:232 (+) Transcript_7328:312-1007(+)
MRPRRRGSSSANARDRRRFATKTTSLTRTRRCTWSRRARWKSSSTTMTTTRTTTTRRTQLCVGSRIQTRSCVPYAAGDASASSSGSSGWVPTSAPPSSPSTRTPPTSHRTIPPVRRKPQCCGRSTAGRCDVNGRSRRWYTPWPSKSRHGHPYSTECRSSRNARRRRSALSSRAPCAPRDSHRARPSPRRTTNAPGRGWSWKARRTPWCPWSAATRSGWRGTGRETASVSTL